MRSLLHRVQIEKDKQPPKVFCKKNLVLKNLANFTGKQLYWSLFFHKVTGLQGTPILKNICERLLLKRILNLHTNKYLQTIRLFRQTSQRKETMTIN